MRPSFFGLFALASLLSGNGAFADDEGMALPPWLTERKIIGHNDLEPIEKTIGTALYAQTRGIARVETVEEGLAFCTATRVGKDLFITNFHCYDFKPCGNVQFHLAFEQGVPVGDQLVVRCKNVLSKSLAHDYALFQVETYGTLPDPSRLPPPQFPLVDTPPHQLGPPDFDTFPIATLWNGPISVGQRVFVAGYPGGRRKEIDRGTDCRLRTVVPQQLEERMTITHNCDTEGGSSGSPLMDFASGYIVGLHWGGTDKFNMAIPISEVIGDLKTQLAPEFYAQLQIADKLEGQAASMAPLQKKLCMQCQQQAEF